MLTYINGQDVVSLSGRLGPRFASWDNTARRTRLELVTQRIDSMLGQSGPPGNSAGVLFAQTGKTYTRLLSRRSDIFWLPNKPVTAVTAISVVPSGFSVYTLPIDTPHKTVYIAGSSFRYVWRSSGVGLFGGPIDPPASSAFNEGDEVTVTYDCGFEPFVPVVGASTTLVTEVLDPNAIPPTYVSLPAGSVAMNVADASPFVEGDLVRIAGDEVVVIGTPGPEDPFYSYSAIDTEENLIRFPYTPTTKSHANGDLVERGYSELPAVIKEAAFKLLQKNYFMDIDDPSGAMDQQRGQDHQTFGTRTFYMNVQDFEIAEMLNEFVIEIDVP